MNDEKSASLILVAGAAGLGWWWWHLTQGKLSGPNPAGASPEPAGGGLPVTTVEFPGSPLERLRAFEAEWHLTETSGLRPESTGSLHAVGRAVDVAPWPDRIAGAITRAAAAVGIHILPELYTGQGRYGHSSGPHYHLSIPDPSRPGHY